MIAEAASAPRHGGQLHRIAESFGIPATGLLDFSANINPEGPSAQAIEALRRALDDPTTLTAYPDLEETQLTLAISAYAGISRDSIAVANGFVPLLDAALRALPVESCLMPVPAFGEYRTALERAGVKVKPYLLDPAEDFRYQPDRLLAEIRKGQHDSILLANPQNPSGVLIDGAVFQEFLEETSRLKVQVFLDEAFIDYGPAHSQTKETERFRNLVVFRSVTKFHGCPGLRVAYAVAQGPIIRKMQQALAPWAITTLAAVGVCATLADSAYRERTLAFANRRRVDLLLALKLLGLETYPAAANFVLIRFPSTEVAEVCWERLIREFGIVLRHCVNFEELGRNHLRCAVLKQEQNARLLEALNQILTPTLPSRSLG